MNHDNLNLPERFLGLLSKFNSFVETTFSTNIDANIQQTDPRALHAGIVGDLASQSTRIPQDLRLLVQLLDAGRNLGLTDDKKYLIEHIIQLGASLPNDSFNLKLISDKLVDLLWGNLQHPPLSYLGDNWRYRTADGSNNNRLYPQLGQAGSPYARTVNPKIQLPPTLPDPGLIFDEVFARGKTTREHPTKMSSMLFHLATIIIHDIFRTNERDWNKVNNSSYLDLSPLYGNSEESQATVRTFENGKLKPDAFAEIRLLAFPPGVSALLVCFNRFHNYVAGELASINEGGRFTLLDAALLSDTDKLKYGTPEKKRDNDLFQTARLVTCGLYMNIILFDYVRTIVNLNQSATGWAIDPRNHGAETAFGPSGIPEGVGNQVSVEFNLVYRWHSAISPKDELWTRNFFKELIPTTEPEDITVEQLRIAVVNLTKEATAVDAGQRTFGGLTRQSDGTFKDEELVNILTESTEDLAAGFGARNVPTCMRVVEIMGIQQARRWSVATLNEFRQYFGMIPHQNFSDISSDPSVAQSLQTLYGDVDLVELYPGLVAEDAKDPIYPGSGLCPGFTVSKAILADAVALVRGDRFYTIDYNAATLTNWGFNTAGSDPSVASGGCMYKLLMRSFPGWYKAASIYAFFPLTIPAKNLEILQAMGKEKDFDYTRPKFVPDPVQIETWKPIVKILEDQVHYKVTWGDHTTYLTGQDYMLSGDKPSNAQQHKFVRNALYQPTNGLEEIRKLYDRVTTSIIYDKSRMLRHTFQIDLVADVANISHAIAVAQLFHVPLKSASQTVGPLTPTAFYTMMSLIFAYVFLDFDPTVSYQLRAGAKQSTDALGALMRTVVTLVQNASWGRLKDMLGIDTSEDDLAKSYGIKLIKRLSEGGKSADEVTWAMIPTIAGAVSTQAQALVQILNLLLTDEYVHHWPHIRELAHSEDPEAFKTLQKYVLECCRIDPSAYGVVRRVDADNMSVVDGKNTIKFRQNDQLFTNFIRGGVDPEVFPDPYQINLERDPSLYIHHGWAAHACIGRELTVTALAAQLRVFAKLKNLRRAPGMQGELKSTMIKGLKVYMKPDWSDYWPFPTTMKVQFDSID